MAHCGLRPQSVHQLGGYKVQRERERLLADAQAAEAAGAFAVVLECIPAEAAARITGELKVPTIGIGAGAGCDGQVLVTPDLLGLFDKFKPRFVKQFANLGQEVERAVKEYCREVRAGSFPAAEHGFR